VSRRQTKEVSMSKTRNTSHCHWCGTDLRYAEEIATRDYGNAVIALCPDRCEADYDHEEHLKRWATELEEEERAVAK